MTEHKTERIASYLSVAVPYLVADLRRVAGLPPAETCILNSKLCVHVLQRFKIEAAPRAVMATLFNREYKLFMDQHNRRPLQEDLDSGLLDPKAWSVMTRSDGIRSPNGEWNGHLVVDVAGTWLLDPSIVSYSRPERGIVIPDHTVTLFRYQAGRAMEWESPNKGTFIYYEWRDADEVWKDCPDWKSDDELFPMLVEKCYRQTVKACALPAKKMTSWN